MALQGRLFDVREKGIRVLPKYAQKVKRKLSKIQGAKCFIVNIVKRTDAKPVESVDETIIQIPYLIDGDKGTINNEAIDYILDRTVQLKVIAVGFLPLFC